MNREMRFAYLVIASAIVLTGIFHTLVYDYPFGWPFALFVALTTFLLIIVRQAHAEPQNLWAYAFLGPLVLGLIANLLYSNDVVRSFGQLMTIASLAFFSYWLFAPKSLVKSLPSFWPGRFFMETLVPLEGAGPGSKLSFSAQGRQVLIGVLISVPLLFIFLVLFLSADALVGKVLRELINIEDPAKLYVQVIFDFILGYYLIRFFWANITRIEHDRRPKWNEIHLGDYSVLWATVLTLLNTLFLGFIGFQFVYFFGGQSIVESYGLTYANYAREGFFQLFTVSVFVFAIIYGIGYWTRFKTLALRLLSLALILQSWIVIASAMKRFNLYIDAYGMSVLRFWAITGLVFAGIGLLVLALWLVTKKSFENLSKVLALGFLYAFSIILLVNHESLIVRWNAGRSASELVYPDYLYPMSLSEDVIPEYLVWLASRPDDARVDCNSIISEIFILSRLEKMELKTIQKQLVDFQSATKDRFKLVANPYEYSDDLESRVVPYAIDWLAPPPSECSIHDIKSMVRIFKRPQLERKMSDLRAWNYSSKRALDSLRSF